jgi:carbon-monoxide dehydrogenase small subunit
MTETPLRLSLNGKPTTVPQVPTEETLLDLLRWRLGLRGTKEGCRTGACGACTLLLDGTSTLSCLVLAREVEGRKVETVEGLVASGAARLVQQAFAESGAVQCGYCTPGFIVAVHALLTEGERPANLESLAQELGGNLCRCTGYYGILRALQRLLEASPPAPSPRPRRSP